MTNQVSFFECLCQLRSRLEWGVGNTVWCVGKNDRQLVSKSAELEETSWDPPLDTFLLHLSSDVKICQVIDKLLWKSSLALYLPLKITIHLEILFSLNYALAWYPVHLFSFNSWSPTFKWCSWWVGFQLECRAEGEGRVWATADTIQNLT